MYIIYEKIAFNFLSSLFLFILAPASLVSCNVKSAITKQDINSYQTEIEKQQDIINQLNTKFVNQESKIDQLIEEGKKNNVNQLNTKFANQENKIDQLNAKLEQLQQVNETLNTFINKKLINKIIKKIWEK